MGSAGRSQISNQAATARTTPPMTTTPSPKPASIVRRELGVGFVTGGFFVLALGSLGIATLGSPSGTRAGTADPMETGAPRSSGAAAYPAAPAPGAIEDTPPAPHIVVLPGLLGEESERVRNVEVIFRLHTWLGLRDLRTGRAALAWSPATVTTEVDAALEEDCEAGRSQPDAAVLRSPPEVPATARRPRDTLIIRMAIKTDADGMLVEAFACRPGGRIYRQVVRDSPDRLGRAQRELLTWLALQLNVADTAPWEDNWGRNPAPGGPVLTGYARALRGSLREPGVPPASLPGAATTLAEAAWLVASLSTDPASKRARLEQAAALRVGFTAAIEDLAAHHTAEGRVDLAEASLRRLDRTTPGSRPIEWGLAWTLLQGDEPREAAQLLRHLPAHLAAEETTARLWSAILPGIEEPESALRWVDALLEHDPLSGAAHLLRGEILTSLKRVEPTASAYKRAAELDPDLREEALRRSVVAALSAGRDADVARRLGDEDLVPEHASLLDLRAFARFRAGDPAGAVDDYLLLAELEPGEVRHRLNICVASLAAGLVPADPDPCGDLPPDAASSNLLTAAALSRVPERSIAQFIELMDRAEEAGRSAPLDPMAADAVLQVAGPFREAPERDRLQGMWRLAVGGERRLTASEKPEEGTEELLPR